MKRHSRYTIVAPAVMCIAAMSLVGAGVMATPTPSPAPPQTDQSAAGAPAQAADNDAQNVSAAVSNQGEGAPAETPAEPDKAAEQANRASAPDSTDTQLASIPPPSGADQTLPDAQSEADRAVEDLCGLMTGAADQYGVPREFFIRLIWKESRFNPGAVSPVGAQGIAQFMPQTARIRGLKDPFDPVQALPASASFLADLEARFGSWGLAAAGYNGGPNRVPPFLAGTGGMPYETRDYVFSITGRSVEYFRNRANKTAAAADAVKQPADASEESADNTAPASAPDQTADDPENTRTTPLADDLAGATVEPRPRARPDYKYDITDCPALVADLGRSRATPPPAGGRGGWTRWGAQVAGHTKRGVAMRQYARVKGRLPQDLVAQGPLVVVRRFAARGRKPIHAVQFAAPNRAAAAAICKRVAKARAPCVVVRNG